MTVNSFIQHSNRFRGSFEVVIEKKDKAGKLSREVVPCHNLASARTTLRQRTKQRWSMSVKQIAKRLDEIEDYGLFMFMWQSISELRDPSLIKACRPAVLARINSMSDTRTSQIYRDIDTVGGLFADIVERRLEIGFDEIFQTEQEVSTPNLTVIDGGLAKSKEK